MRPQVQAWQGEDLLQVTYYCQDSNLLEEIDAIFAGAVHTHLRIAHEQTAAGTGKDAAAYYQIPLEATAAIGDSGNDIAMLQEAGIGAAMGNAAEECRSAVDFVTGRIEEDGFYDAICHLLEQ